MNKSKGKVIVIHDWDFPLYQRKTCLKRALWLFLYAIFGNFSWFRKRMPKWLLYEKYNQALALAELDKMLNIRAIFGLTDKVKFCFPDIEEKLENLGFEVRYHYHVKQKAVGRGRWDPPLNVKPLNMVYDRRYALKGERELPSENELVVWHVDHMQYNLPFYLEFIRRCKEKNLL